MSINISCRIDESQAECLDRLAQEQGTTRAGIIRNLIDGLDSTPDPPGSIESTPNPSAPRNDLAPVAALALMAWCLYRARKPRP